MEIKSKVLRKLPLKFHEDDTYGYESRTWREYLRADESDRRAKVTPVPFANRIKTDMIAHSAMGTLEWDTESKMERLFGEAPGYKTKHELTRIPRKHLISLLGDKHLQYFLQLIKTDSFIVSKDCSLMIHSVRRMLEDVKLKEQEFILKQKIEHMTKYRSLVRLKYVLSSLYNVLVELRYCFESGNPGDSEPCLDELQRLKAHEKSSAWNCIQRSSQRRWLKNGLEAIQEQSSIDRLIQARESELTRLARKRGAYWGLCKVADKQSKEVELKENSKIICRVCQNSTIPTDYFKEHSQKCFKIACLTDELKVINDWLIKECEKAQLLKNNVGFDMVIANHITTRGSEDIEDETKSIEMMREAEKKAKAVVMEMHKNRISKFKARHKKCPTTDDFSKLHGNRQPKQMPDIPQEKDEDCGEGVLPSKFQAMGRVEVQGEEISESNTVEIQVSKQPTPTKKSPKGSSNWTWLSNSSPLNGKKSKPSRFKEIYKKPSEGNEKFKSGDSQSMDKETHEQSQPTQAVKYVGDLFHSDDENEKSDKEPILDKEKKSQSSGKKSEKRDELLDAPDFVDDMFSDKSSKHADSKIESRKIAISKDSKSDSKESDKEARPKQIAKEDSPKEKPISNSEQLIKPKLVESSRSFQIDKSLDNSEEAIKQRAHQHRVYQMSKFSSIKHRKNFSTQVNLEGTPDRGSQEPALEKQDSDLSGCITKAKICHEFFDKLISYGGHIQKKNALGENHHDDMNMIRYLECIISNEVFDVKVVKNVATKFLKKLEERSKVITAIDVLKLEDAKARNIRASLRFNQSFNQKQHQRNKSCIDQLENQDSELGISPKNLNITSLLQLRKNSKADRPSNSKTAESGSSRNLMQMMRSMNKTSIR